jgi:hypothetical protein
MRTGHVLLGGAGVVLMAFVIFGSVYPVPDFPYSILPYLFAAYLLLGALWYGILAGRGSKALIALHEDLEFS